METIGHFKNRVSHRIQRNKVRIALFGILLFCCHYAYSQATAKIENIWQTHHVVKDNEQGMNIHIKFSFTEMLNKTGRCSVYFYKATGSVLEDTNQRYRTANGQVSTGVPFTPNIADGIYNDFSVFIPYAELHLPSGRHDIKFDVTIFDDNRQPIAQSDFQECQVDWSPPTRTQPSQSVPQQPAQTQTKPQSDIFFIDSQSYTGDNPKFESGKRTSINVGVLMGGGSLLGVDFEFLLGKHVGLQLGAGMSSVGFGINCHLQPDINSQFVSLQYLCQGFGQNHFASYLGPVHNFRVGKILQFGIGLGAVLSTGPRWEATYEDKKAPAVMLLYNIGVYFPL